MKKSILASATAAMMFGLMGLGFAMWSDTVTVSAAVNTGNVAVGIRDVGTNDNILTTDILGGTATNTEDGVVDAMTFGGDPQVTPGVNTEGKNVASMISENTGTVDFTIGGVDYYSEITETITNAYPYYAPTTRFEIASNGTIPVKLDKINIEDSGMVGLNYGTWTVTYPSGATATGTGLDALKAEITNDNGVQLHQGDKVTVDLQVWFAQVTPQNSSGTLTMIVHAAQWNEAGQDDPYRTDF